MPPIVAWAEVLTSTGNHRPCGRSHVFNASSTTPGSTVTVALPGAVAVGAVTVAVDVGVPVPFSERAMLLIVSSLSFEPFDEPK